MNSKGLNIGFPDVKKSWGIVLFAVSIALAGCGGGGSSSASMDNDLPSPVAGGVDGEDLIPGPDGQEPATPSELELLPKVSVGQRQFADPNVLLTLSATAQAAEGAQIVTTLWTQVTGPAVRIPSPRALTNLILMPDVNLATQLEFRFTAVDSEGRINSATVLVLVKPVPTFVKVTGGVFDEASEEAVFTVRLNAPSTLPVTVSYITQDGSADSETDYVFTSGEVVFEPGEVFKEIPVVLINDTLVEDDESFSLRVTAIDGEMTYANVGIVIIRNGTEPQMEQDLQFSNPGPVTIFIDDEYTNPLNPDVPSPGTGDIIYSSSNTEVAVVDAEGTVVGVGLGEAEISATKLADDTYLSVTNSYTLRVVTRGATPTVEIVEVQDGYSILVGDTLDLFGSAFDEEDGSLPTQAQIDESSATGQPIQSLRWTSNLEDFVLGYGDVLDTDVLQQGTHTITYSATDSDGNTGSSSIRVLVGNLSPYASEVFASSTYCPDVEDVDNCYNAFRAVDTNLSTAIGGTTSWTNELNAPFPQYLTLFWSSPVTINTVDIYTSETLPLRDYDIEYFDGENTWLTLVSINGNTEVYRSHAVTQVTTNELRVVVRSGPDDQTIYGRINEIVVFGTIEFLESF